MINNDQVLHISCTMYDDYIENYPSELYRNRDYIIDQLRKNQINTWIGNGFIRDWEEKVITLVNKEQILL